MKTDELIAMAAKTAAEIKERQQQQTGAGETAPNAVEPMPSASPVQVEAPSLQTPQTPFKRPEASLTLTKPSQGAVESTSVGNDASTQAAPTPSANPHTEETPVAAPAPLSQPSAQPIPQAMPSKAAPAAAAAASIALTNGAAPMAPQPATAKASWQDGLPTGNRNVVSKGLIFIFGFLGIFLVWAFLFPISSAVVAPGKIVSAGANKLIQHPVGGVVRDISIREGEMVQKNQVILTLDPSISRAELTRLLARRRMLSAMQARLTSGDGEDGFTTTLPGLQLRGTQTVLGNSTGVMSDTALAALDDPLIEQQRREFEAGRKRLAAEIDAASSQIESLKDERSGLQARLAGEKRLLNFSNMEIGKVRPLANEGLLPKVRLWDLEKKRLEQVTAVSNLEATIDATSQRIAESEAKLAQLTESDTEKRSEELTKVIGELGEIKDQILAAQVSLNSTELRAPVSGVLTNMTANTVGGVIKSGDPIAEIVPATAGLITEFRVPLDKVRSVKVGQKARIVVTAFNRRTYDPIQGEVIYVAADSQLDPVTQETFFLARARLNENPDKNNGIGEIQAGMPTEVYALSTPRVFMSYVFQPVYDSFDKAFRETN